MCGALCPSLFLSWRHTNFMYRTTILKIYSGFLSRYDVKINVPNHLSQTKCSGFSLPPSQYDVPNSDIETQYRQYIRIFSLCYDVKIYIPNLSTQNIFGSLTHSPFPFLSLRRTKFIKSTSILPIYLGFSLSLLT